VWQKVPIEESLPRLKRIEELDQSYNAAMTGYHPRKGFLRSRTFSEPLEALQGLSPLLG
jgi:hypothetical protein